jgi:hypothetical protein
MAEETSNQEQEIKDMRSALWRLLYIVIPDLQQGGGKHTPETLLYLTEIESSYYAPCPGSNCAVGKCVAENMCGCSCGDALMAVHARD